MNNIIDGLKIIGGLAGIAALTWRIYEEFKVFLRIKVEVSKSDNITTILTEIENTSRFANKEIENTFLIITHETSDLIKGGERIAEYLNITNSIKNTNDFECLKANKTIYIDKKIVFVPLTFFYSENVRIGDEKLSYRCSIDNKELESGNYSVRLYLFGKKRYHRSTQDLLIIE